ncbi:MAG: CDGSH iron-sulfur domain-containing protein [Actinomycetota bacterium]
MTGKPAHRPTDRGSEPIARVGAIRVYPDGLLLVRGDFVITDEHGRVMEIDRKVVSLCRCGRSGLAPLCDGSHAKSSNVGKRVKNPPGA